MSNTENQLPAYLQAYMAQNTATTDADSMSAVKTSVPRISLKGKRFKFIDGENESKGADTIHVAILAVEPPGGLMNKTFYKGGYNPNDTAPPDCASSNGINPDGWIENPCADLCAKCPNNMFGSATSMSGKKAKACKDSKVLWVAKPDDVNGIVYGLKVPVTSLKPMSEYGKVIKQLGAPLAAVVTELTMDEDNEFPLLAFKNVGFLNNEAGEQAINRSMQREWIDHSAPVMLDAPTGSGAEKIEYKGTGPGNAKADATIIDHEEQPKTATDVDVINQNW